MYLWIQWLKRVFQKPLFEKTMDHKIHTFIWRQAISFSIKNTSNLGLCHKFSVKNLWAPRWIFQCEDFSSKEVVETPMAALHQPLTHWGWLPRWRAQQHSTKLREGVRPIPYHPWGRNGIFTNHEWWIFVGKCWVNIPFVPWMVWD